MTGADVSLPLPEASPAQVTCLEHLPDEMLAKIARSVAPFGGRKAQNLRLVNRHLSTIATPIFFASISIPDQSSDTYVELLASLLGNSHGIKNFATSIAYQIHEDGHATAAATIRSLVNLRRVSLSGSSPHSVLTKVLQKALASLPRLNTLSLSDFRVDLPPYTDGALLKRCTKVRHLILRKMKEDGVFASRWGADNPDPSAICLPETGLEMLEVYYPAEEIGDNETRYIILALTTCQSTVREITLEWKQASANNGDEQFARGTLSPSVQSLRIKGLVPLFKSGNDSMAHSTTSAYMATFLGWVGTSSLPRLCLPVQNVFEVHLALMAPAEPPHLRLSSNSPPAQSDIDPNVPTTQNSYSNLSKLLKGSIFPGLRTLQLVGWFDRTRFTSLVKIPPRNLAKDYPDLYALLGLLRVIGVTNLVLENSSTHQDGKEVCFFERAGDDWSVRIARYW
ncbi:hypothetical protein P7C70_g8467, partial [Phenoliferia sp. Uapishka_3]